MTIKLPSKNITDRILSFLGKQRAIIIPPSTAKGDDPYVYSQARKESFFKALLRHKNSPLPDGLMYLSEFNGKRRKPETQGDTP